MDLKHLFQTENPILGVVHLLPLPTSARWGGDFRQVMDRAEQEATALAAGGIDGIIIENFFDAPFTKDRVDPATISAMTLIMDRLAGLVTVPLGLNVLRNDAKSAMAIAACTGAQFIRVNVLTGVMATDQGLIEGNAYELLKYRRELDADVAILADVLVKHAHPISTPNLTAAIHDTVERGLADAVILSGWATGQVPKMDDLKDARANAGDTPILIGSGATWENIGNLLQVADGAIVASSLKRHGKLSEPIDPLRVSQFMESAQQGIKIRQMRQKQFA
ncbi:MULTISPECIES: photosystem I biogenesis protein BtpA [Cyanophyceae]|uniref:photosystem I biogenesis protein BtpA n=1 Tax=Cyanophyceae TaxID=3028117 RepID=UPI00016DC531|nr:MULTISPECIES: BtpA/SgcQ family protein [Cyanophyceae]ACA98978.1 Photosystem I biogenesis protein btpA [Picosynechococcus sp. PCC 7002]AMA08731.1 phosphorybosylanthranilate isomerase [Picosynechococcus sp. PCC 73109]ANV86876.1 phosphorybosylanthranilate isomerase [Picosynechococcus sp. PCC 7117]ANV90034.1 phosphorybosylanthranilate isomerase [Picosynechococcus sp. PCC 8807]QCS49661.1 BtpA/SgcQ family protein [Picosynechococcus sp. PCC 11901]